MIQAPSLLDQITNPANSELYNWTFRKLVEQGISEQIAHITNTILLLIVAGIFLFIIDFLANKIFNSLLVKLIQKTKTNIDDHLVKNKTFKYISHYIPLIIAKNILPLVFSGFNEVINVLDKMISLLMIVTMLMIIHSIFKSVRDVARTKASFADKPLDSYLQVVQIFLFFLGGTIVFSILTGSSPWTFIASLGAASAILMLVFKDTILGFVASIQVSANDSIRVGDWIEMPKYGADGDVIEINLNNIKIQNFDKTVTTIPTYLLLSDSFKNWRGMQASGGRRIKRSIALKISSIRFLNKEEIEELKKIKILRTYIEERSIEIDQYNQQSQADESMPVNGRKMTNVGLFRAYIKYYAQNNPSIHQQMTLMQILKLLVLI